MTRFAVVFSGPAANTVSTADVNQRNLSCLKLTGQVSFPYTLAQLKQGVSISVAPGSYTVQIVGYSGVPGTPTTIAQIFSDSSSLKSFAIANALLDTTATSSVRLTSTYVKATATDLIAACPTPQNGLQSAYSTGNELYLMSYSGTEWDESLVASPQILGSYSLNVDSQRTAHVSYIDASSGGYVLKYAQKLNGNLTFDTIRVAGENSPHAIVTDFGGTTYVLTKDNPSNQTRARLFRKASGWIDDGVRLNQSNNIADIQLAASSINNALVAVSASVLSGDPVHVEYRDPSEAWTTIGDFSSAGAYNCDNGTTNLHASFDSLGFAHIVFECIGPQVHLGYLTNRSGAWASYDLTPSAIAAQTTGLSLSLDSDNDLHVLFAVQNSVRYIKGDLDTLTFTPVESVFDSTVTLDRVTMKAAGPNEIRALFMEHEGGPYRIYPLEKRQNIWEVGLLITSTPAPALLQMPIF